jgi:two-component system sensor histidine kinase HydH
VQDFLDFTRPPALQRRVLDLRDVLEAALALVRTRARQQKVELVGDGPPQPVPALVDRDQLCTVLVNLFINALDAMPRGGRLEVRLGPSDEGIQIVVRDTGGGIAPNVLGQLFTPFTSTKATGTGLGLCISRRIVEDHGGRLCGSNADGGACFILTLPAISDPRSTISD